MEDVSSMFEGKGAPAGASTLDVINTLADECLGLVDQIEKISELLKAAQDRKNQITQFELPEALKDARLTSFESQPDDEGKYIEVKLQDYWSGKLPDKLKEPEKRKEALDYIEADPDMSALLKTLMTLEFGKGEHNVALSVAEGLKEQGFTVDMELGVNHQTLLAFCREAMKDGKNIDLEKLGVGRMTVAKISPKVVKVKKGKK
jgi:hypothetical protein